jgi:hydroxymethylpyrimidine pyrophosphatase-like HAD family hydrolase
MVGYLRVVALDYDGTLTHDGQRPSAEVLEALATARASGLTVLLVTGRILSELKDSFPDVDDWVDLVVAENGCVLTGASGSRRLAPPVDSSLLQALLERNVTVRQGDVLLAGSADDRVAVMEEIHRLELDCQLVFNRSELMVLPAGVTKGTGLFDALGDVGISRHSAVGVGDAENDHALLDVCEVGVAVSNAVVGLRATADVILDEPDGRGIMQLLDRMERPDAPAMHSPRWQVQLGTTVTGAAVSVPSSQVNVLVCGSSGSGKSYVAGLFAERLIAQGYCVLMVDPEGDHQGLGRLRGVVVIDAQDGLPSPAQVAALFSQRFTSVVLDLSLVPVERRHAYLERLTVEVEKSREATGLPHWVISDEAHESATGMHPESSGMGEDAEGRWGSCLVTYRPDLIEPEQLERTDAVIALGQGGALNRHVIDLLAGVCGEPPEQISQHLSAVGPGSGFLAVRRHLGTPRTFRVGSRVTEHRRHLRKYLQVNLPPERSFYFRDRHDRQVAVASNIAELQRVVRDCADGVLEHHARGRDLSRWIDAVFGDEDLSMALAVVESHLAAHEITAGEAREAYLGAVRVAYPL